ncbi:MAG: single-stranded DNA-binding protein [Clostridiales bacterium]|nr:single-stranded DNA-binding protein [Clostridiales bacterium]
MNRVILMGRLTRDPEVRYSQSNMAIARYTLAVDRRGRRNQDGGDQQQTADFINIVAFDRSAEFAQKYFHQGMRVLVSGRIQTGSYTNKDGQRVYTTDIIVDDQEFADSKNASNGGGSYGGGYQPTSRPAPSSAIGDGFMNIPDGVEDEGLPFN